MPAPTQEFSVGIVMGVTKNVAVLSFPAFPKGGTLLVLQPAWVGEEPSLSGYAAEIRPPSGAALLLNYEYWHLNDDHALGLLSSRVKPEQVPLGSKVTFVARKRGVR